MTPGILIAILFDVEIICPILTLVLDLAIRFWMCKKRNTVVANGLAPEGTFQINPLGALLHPHLGGHIFFIPAWIIGIITFFTGVPI
jgi:hypothetical protein